MLLRSHCGRRMEGGKTRNECSLDKKALNGTMHPVIKCFLEVFELFKGLGDGGDRDRQIAGVGVSRDLITVGH